jgi:predicted nucleotidyltransferase
VSSVERSNVAVDRIRTPPTRPAPSLAELRRGDDEIERIAGQHGVATVRVFGSVARGDPGPSSDLDLLVEMDDR